MNNEFLYDLQLTYQRDEKYKKYKFLLVQDVKTYGGSRGTDPHIPKLSPASLPRGKYPQYVGGLGGPGVA